MNNWLKIRTNKYPSDYEEAYMICEGRLHPAAYGKPFKKFKPECVRRVMLDGLLGSRRIEIIVQRVCNLYKPQLSFLLSELILTPVQLFTGFYEE